MFFLLQAQDLLRIIHDIIPLFLCRSRFHVPLDQLFNVTLAGVSRSSELSYLLFKIEIVPSVMLKVGVVTPDLYNPGIQFPVPSDFE